MGKAAPKSRKGPQAPHQQQQQQGKPEQPLKGVAWDPKRRTWKARIHFAGKERFIGRWVMVSFGPYCDSKGKAQEGISTWG
jgi:hypothetical protein